MADERRGEPASKAGKAKRSYAEDKKKGFTAGMTMTTGPVITREIPTKKYSRLGLGRTAEGRKPRKRNVPFERGSIGLRKKSRSSSRKSGR
jgi:hypothetical protein